MKRPRWRKQFGGFRAWLVTASLCETLVPNEDVGSLLLPTNQWQKLYLLLKRRCRRGDEVEEYSEVIRYFHNHKEAET